MSICGFDIEWDRSDQITSYGIASNDECFSVRVVTEEQDLRGMCPIKDPDHDHSDIDWGEWLLEKLNKYDYVVGNNVSNDITKFEKSHPEIYRVLKAKYRDIGHAMNELFEIKSPSSMSLSKICEYMDTDNTNHHNPKHDAFVAFKCTKYYPFLNWQKYSINPKTTCPYCGLERHMKHQYKCKNKPLMNQIMQQNTCKPIPGFPGYTIDRDANVYSSKGKRLATELKDGNGGMDGNRKYVGLTQNGKRTTQTVDRLYAFTFGPERPSDSHTLWSKTPSDKIFSDNLVWIDTTTREHTHLMQRVAYLKSIDKYVPRVNCKWGSKSKTIYCNTFDEGLEIWKKHIRDEHPHLMFGNAYPGDGRPISRDTKCFNENEEKFWTNRYASQ